MAKGPALRELLEDLAGQDSPLPDLPLPEPKQVFLGSRGLGYSQLNELLLLVGFDRIDKSFFQYLVDGRTTYVPGSCISSLPKLCEGIERFRQMALLIYGNVKFAFKQLSRKPELLEHYVEETAPIDPSATGYKLRHDAIVDLEPIAPEETYYLGSVIEGRLRERLKNDPNDAEALSEEAKRVAIVDKGTRNNRAYLASDHLDVYVATSMRERHEYLQIADFTKAVFGHKTLKDLKLRFFDPTQAYCRERIDKGLTEALMLRRATCTIYLSQEADSFGKDSELASTLAQGKPVIAFVPRVTKEFFDNHLRRLQNVYKTQPHSQILLDQLRVFDPGAAWTNPDVRKWIDEPAKLDVEAAERMLLEKMTKHYDGRAKLLTEIHPLGIQMDILSGVANGVLVVRSTDECVELLERILMNKMEFDLAPQEDPKYLHLTEKTSNSIYRVVTGDPMLTNIFWNFYTSPGE